MPDLINVDALADAIFSKLQPMIHAEFRAANNQLPVKDETDEIFDVAGAAHFLGLAKSSVYCNSGLPVMKRGKKNYYSKKDLIQWLRSGKRKTVAEVDSEVDETIKKSVRK